MTLFGPYRTAPCGKLEYIGNNVFPPGFKLQLDAASLRARYAELGSTYWQCIALINDSVFSAASRNLESTGARFIPLPLTTRMISSPGAVYGQAAIDYTTDTAPIRLDWFDLPDKVFLSESSQIYLELALSDGCPRVYSIYNSFRLEQADEWHLSEFHHVEFEGRVSFEENLAIVEGLLRSILGQIFDTQVRALESIVSPAQLKSLEGLLIKERLFTHVSFAECLDLLYKDTGRSEYEQHTLASFGRWEEVRITELIGGLIAIHEYPLLEVPFYHATVPDRDDLVARNADVIWPGFAEIVGAGERIGSIDELRSKAEIFNLPAVDYAPYLDARLQPGFEQSCGFGLGWERLVQGILSIPHIALTCPFPRTHFGAIP